MQLSLSKALEFYVAALEPGAAREAVYEAIRRAADGIRQLPPGSARARELHRRVDEAAAAFAELKPELAAAVRCGRGCSHCCRMGVAITGDEARLLAERILAGSARADSGRLRAQRDWAAPADFIGRPLEEAACVFLGADGACTVHEDRPSACRALLVTSAPEHCRRALADTRVTAVINPYVELLVSAALSGDLEPGPRMLAARLGRLLFPRGPDLGQG
jgi:Fe-S-cluster containining protein